MFDPSDPVTFLPRARDEADDDAEADEDAEVAPSEDAPLLLLSDFGLRRDDEDMDLDDTDDTKSVLEWKEFTTVFDMRPHQDTDYPLFDLRSERPDAGHRYLFRIFMRNKSTGETTPPSRRSAVISLMEDEE